MDENTIICPFCKARIPLTDAVTHGIRDQLEREFNQRQQALQESLAAKEVVIHLAAFRSEPGPAGDDMARRMARLSERTRRHFHRPRE